MLRATLLLMILSTPAMADCVTRDDLATGVILRFQDGTPGTVVALSDGSVQINYRNDDSGYFDLRDAVLGIFETRVRVGGAPPDVIGIWADRTETRRFQGRLPQPEPGRTWTTTVNMRWDVSDHSGTPRDGRERWSVSYAFLDARQVTLSGCDYISIPVEATYADADPPRIQRFAYFPDLGFGVETQVTFPATGVVNTNGLSAMVPAQ